MELELESRSAESNMLVINGPITTGPDPTMYALS